MIWTKCKSHKNQPTSKTTEKETKTKVVSQCDLTTDKIFGLTPNSEIRQIQFDMTH